MKLKPVKLAAPVAAGILVASLVPGPYGTVNRIGPRGSCFLQSAQLDPEAVSTLRRACGNCHSNQPEWPWYSRIAPISWLLCKDVSEGHKFLNFSMWPEYRREEQSQLLALAATERKRGWMPPFRYSAVHMQARISGRVRSRP